MNPTDAAYSSLKRRLLDGEWSSGERLPSLAGLAAICGVSRATMWKVVARLKKESLLHTRERGAVIAGPDGFRNSAPSARPHAWQRVKTLLGRELIGGLFDDTHLPPLNKIALRYGAAIETVKKAVRQLEREGVVTRIGRQYQLTQHHLSLKSSTLFLIAKGDKERGIYMPERRTETLVESFERDCLRLGYTYRCEAFDDRDSKGVIEFTSMLKGIGAAKGCIVNLWNPRNETFWTRWLDLLHLLVSRKLPVIVVDQEGDLSFPGTILNNDYFRVLRISTLRAGEIVASGLVRRKQQRIAFVAPFFGYPWAQSRYAGLQQHMKKYGTPPCTVAPFELTEFSNHESLTWGFLGLDKHELVELYKERYSSEEIKYALARIDEIRNNPTIAKIRMAPVASSIHDITRLLKQLRKKGRDRGAFETILGALEFIAGTRAQEWYLQPLFKRVLAENYPVWVCANDNTARFALAFLRRTGIRVPEMIAVYGFDNSRDAHEDQLSSFDFNMNGVAHRALQLILDDHLRKIEPVISEVDGYVVERKTSRT